MLCPFPMLFFLTAQGNSLSATGSGSIVKALQAASLSREMVVRVPSRPASPAAASRGASANFGDGGADISIDEVNLNLFITRASIQGHIQMNIKQTEMLDA